MTNKEYNGWFNYETWLVNLWIDNEQGSQSYWQEQAEECYKQAKRNDTPDDAEYTLATQLQDYFEREQEQLTGVTGFWSDLLGAAMSEVNWREIAEHMIEDVDKAQFAND